MNIILNHVIMESIQLPWIHVSPIDAKGLEYHLTPDLSIHLNGILSGDLDFLISHIILDIEGLQINELQAEPIFLNEFLPAKSKERVAKSLKDSETSCFFTTKQMEYLHKLFEERNFMSCDVSVYYQGRRIDDIAELPSKEFKLAIDAFEELNVMAVLNYKKQKGKLKDAYAANFRKKVAAQEDRTTKTLWDRVKHKNMRKKIGLAFGAMISGAFGMIVKSNLATKKGIGFSAVGLVLGTLGIVIEMYGKNQAQQIVQQLS
jgi:hypothetical protein